MRLWERRERLPEEANPLAYLLTSLRRDLVRERKREARTSGEIAEQRSADDSPESRLTDAETAAERSERVATAIDQLSARERELVHLRFRENLAYEEIVEVTGLSYQSARNTLARALKKLRARLAATVFSLAVSTSALLDTLPLGLLPS